MSNPDNNILTGELPGLVNVSAVTIPTSILTLVPPQVPSPSHVTTSSSTSTSTSTSANMDPDFHALYTALGSNPLLKTTLPVILKLASVNNYTDWLSKIIRVFNLCKVTKILTGEWTEPTIKPKDVASEQNVEAWHVLDSWIILHLNLLDSVNSQVWHLMKSHKCWTKLKKLFKLTSTTSITLHLTSIINICFNESTKFEDFMVSKCKHNQMIGELGGQSLPDSHIAILICCGLPEHLRQQVAHLMDDAITTDQLINIIRSHQQQSEIQTMQASTSDTTLYSCQNKSKKKHNLQPCKTPGCPQPNMHQTQNC